MPSRDYAVKRLQDANVENAAAEARWMTDILKQRRAALPPGQSADELLEAWLNRRIAGEPFQYIVGNVEFYSVELEVGPGVLIPRPETELLVERALELLNAAPAGAKMLDLCTGSGAIPLAIAHENPGVDCTGIDISDAALSWAKRNCERLHPGRCRFLQGDLFTPLGTPQPQFALITANPPYISPDDYQQLPAVVHDYEPRLALEAEDDGLALEKRIADEARQWLLPAGHLLLEIGDTQGPAMQEYLTALGYRNVCIRKDLAQKDRIAEGEWPNQPQQSV